MKFKLRNSQEREAVKQYIDKLPDGDYEGEVSKKKKKRSPSQNSLYWMYLSCIKDETGNDVDSLHKHFREKYLPITTSYLGSSLIEKLTSTTTLTTVQFKDYLDQIVAFAATELSIILPDPNDLIFEQFYEEYGNTYN
jgi:hypothetical protein